MLEIVIGLLLLALGIWGVFDAYYYVADFIKGGLPVFLMLWGLLSMLAGIIPVTGEKEDV